MNDFLAMGGYAKYVWPAYVIFLVVLAWDWTTPVLRRRRLIAELRGRIVREQVRRRNAARTQPEIPA